MRDARGCEGVAYRAQPCTDQNPRKKNFKVFVFFPCWRVLYYGERGVRATNNGITVTIKLQVKLTLPYLCSNGTFLCVLPIGFVIQHV